MASAPAATPTAAENRGVRDCGGRIGGTATGPPPEFNLVGGVLCLVGLLIRLGLMLHWGASDLLAVKLPLLYFHKDSIGYMSTQTHFLRSLKGELFQSNFFFPDNLYLIVCILFPCSPKYRPI